MGTECAPLGPRANLISSVSVHHQPHPHPHPCYKKHHCSKMTDRQTATHCAVVVEPLHRAW